jgi:hypothetical protein
VTEVPNQVDWAVLEMVRSALANAKSAAVP